MEKPPLLRRMRKRTSKTGWTACESGRVYGGTATDATISRSAIVFTRKLTTIGGIVTQSPLANKAFMAINFAPQANGLPNSMQHTTATSSSRRIHSCQTSQSSKHPPSDAIHMNHSTDLTYLTT